MDEEKLPILSDEEVRAMLRLLGEVVEIEGFIAQKQFLMSGLSALIDADSWAWATTCKFDPNEVPVSSGFMSGGFSPAQFAKFQEALEHPDTGMLNAAFAKEFEQKKTHLTRLRDQLDVNQVFPGTKVYPIWIAAGVEHVLLSIRPGTEPAISRRSGSTVVRDDIPLAAGILESPIFCFRRCLGSMKPAFQPTSGRE